MLHGLSSLKERKKINFYNPCISVYMPTNKKLDNTFKTRDRVKFMRIINKIESHLVSNSISRSLVNKILKPAKELIEDQKFWIQQDECFVMFLAEDFYEYYQLPVKSEFAVFIDTEFNVKPLAALMENSGQSQPQIPEARPANVVKKFPYRQQIA
jgi:hypothetical protein